MVDKAVLNNIVNDIKALKKGDRFSLDTYLEKYKITDIQERFDYTFEVLAILDKLVDMAPEDKGMCLGMPWVFEFIKVQ